MHHIHHYVREHPTKASIHDGESISQSSNQKTGQHQVTQKTNPSSHIEEHKQRHRQHTTHLSIIRPIPICSITGSVATAYENIDKGSP